MIRTVDHYAEPAANSAQSISPSHVRHYLNKLVRLSEQINVRADGDIHCAEGRLWLPAGGSLSADFSAGKRSLGADFDSLLTLEGAIRHDNLISHFSLFFESDPALLDFARRMQLRKRLEPLCMELRGQKSLMNKLTCLSYCFPVTFKRALFSAAVGVAAVTLKPETSISPRVMFTAALFHGVGLLFLPDGLTDGTRMLSADERLVMQTYPELGASVLENRRGIDAGVAQAVLEHRENLDGTGYPMGKVGTQICPAAQLLNTLSALHAAYQRRLKPARRHLRDLVPIIKMNGHTRFGRHGLTLIDLLQEDVRANQPTLPDAAYSDFFNLVRKTYRYITECEEIGKAIANTLGFRHNERNIYALQNAIIHVGIAVSQSEVINMAYLRWLSHVEQHQLEHAWREVEDTYLRMHEVIVHIEALRHRLSTFFCELTPENEWYEPVRISLEKLRAVQRPLVPPGLLNTWVETLARNSR